MRSMFVNMCDYVVINEQILVAVRHVTCHYQVALYQVHLPTLLLYIKCH